MANNELRIIVTGGAGFIGGTLVRYLLQNENVRVLNIDKMTYVSSLATLEGCIDDPRHTFRRLDLAAREELRTTINDFRPHQVIHLAAQTHVDNSIESPDEFINANIGGTFNLLESCREFWSQCQPAEHAAFRFLHVSTDEVYGDLAPDEAPFTETTSYKPSSPYSASKAASDHLVRAWHRTYGFPALITNCSNNYGPYQYPEKLIPVIVTNALSETRLPVYGDGRQRRDWLYVEDHARALARVAASGIVGETYNIGGRAECSNLDIVTAICATLDELSPRSGGARYADLVEHVRDRPGHDRRYAINCDKIVHDLEWLPSVPIEDGLRHTVKWYFENQQWCRQMLAQKPADLHWLK